MNGEKNAANEITVQKPATKLARLWFRKDGVARYISHLDLMRCVGRALHRAKIPIWYTEGFNPRPFMTFALPLSLGIRGMQESVDVKMTAQIEEKALLQGLNAGLPEGIVFYAYTDPVMTPGDIRYADFSIKLRSSETPSALAQKISSALEQPQLLIEKKTKAGKKQIDIKEGLMRHSIEPQEGFIKLQLLLTAGSVQNTNPSLLLEAIQNQSQAAFTADITRLGLLNADMQPFA